MRLKILLLPLFLLLSAYVYGQPNQIQFSRIDLRDGLSHNQVNAIRKDAKGFLWFGTFSGLNRYDGYDIKVFKHNPRDTTSISNDFITDIFELPDHHLYLETRNGPNVYNGLHETFTRNVKAYLKGLHIEATTIRDILKDDEGNFWFNAVEEGIFKYEVATAKTIHLKCDGKSSTSLGKTPVSAMQKGPKGAIWIIHQDKSIEILDRKTGKVQRRIVSFQKKSKAEFQDFKFFLDNQGDFWIYTLNNQSGIDYYSSSTGEIRFIDKGAMRLNNNLINGILQDNNGLIWIATDHGGVNLLDKHDFSIRYLVNRENDQKSIGQNSITSIYKDTDGIIWIGTFKKGISYYHEKILKFPLYRHQGTNPNGLTYDDINRFVEDDQGNLWIGTNGGGLFYFNRKTGQFKRYRYDATDPNSLSNDIIVSLYIDKQKILWIGTYFGGLDRFDGKQFKHYKHQPGNPNSLADDRVWDMLEDRKGRFWVATLSGGLDRLDRATGIFYHKKANEPNSVKSNFISSLIEDKSGNLWIGSSDGVDVLQADGRFVHFENKPADSNSLINNVVYDVMQDSHGFIWIATRDGLSRFDPKSKKFRNFDAKDGLTEKATLKIIEDGQRNLWVSTANGLFNMMVKKPATGDFTYFFRKYDEQDGLQGNAFNANAGYKTRAGELLFGGSNGFNIFKPENIRKDDSKPLIVLSGLQLANKPVGVGAMVDEQVLLKQSLHLTDTLELKYSQNGFALDFAALNFFSPQNIKYKYKLEGFDQQWQELQENGRRATYTNIDPGEYVFKVVSTDASGNWLKNETSLKVIILPPFWKTNFAYFIYICCIGGTLFLMRRIGIRKARNKFLLEQERQQARRMHELDMLKIKFLTNVSHEFRTPLSLIITPLEKLIKEAAPAEKNQLQMIQRNGRRLLNLVNQLLDFRRMEVHEVKLQLKQDNLIAFIKELCYSFTDVADRNNISLSFSTDRKSMVTFFDHDKMERIIFNLLSNAFKFTPAGGKVAVMLHARTIELEKTELRIEVQDTGIGIEKAKHELIFERFFQDTMPDSIVNQGSGIGLSITKEFVKLQGGTITVDSEVNKGSTFAVTLLFPEEVVVAEEVVISQPLMTQEETTIPEVEVDAKSKKPIVVLVEDNDDFRFYLKDNLKEFYQIVEAVNGKDGWQKILAAHPDLIVSDVSMPEMNGTDLCKKIKSDKRTAHLPVILLTALTTEAQQLNGLETGANDYMTKPFNFGILQSKIKNLLQQQALSKKTYQKQVDFKPAETAIESVDDKFIRQLSLHLEKNLGDASYTVDQLSADLHMSRVGLYKKILPLTGKTPLEYIRLYRLQKSKPLLLKSQMTISEVAYTVGFSNPKHFSKYFKQEFDVLPSVYAASND